MAETVDALAYARERVRGVELARLRSEVVEAAKAWYRNPDPFAADPALVAAIEALEHFEDS